MSTIKGRPKKKEESGVGWKVFYDRGKQLHFAAMSLRGSTVVTEGEWLNAERRVEESSDGTPYVTGFHIFLEKPKVERKVGHKAVKVKYQMAHLVGTNYHWPSPKRVLTVVADRMFVPKQRKTK